MPEPCRTVRSDRNDTMNDDSPWKPPSSDQPHLTGDPSDLPFLPAPPPPTTISSAPGAGDARLDTADPEGTLIEVEASGPRRPRFSRLAVGGSILAVVALGAAGIFALDRFGDASTGGGSSAEDLGRQLLAAIEEEDVLGVIDTLSPGERDTLGAPFVEFVGELQRLEVLSADADLSALAGFDVEFSSETVTARGTDVTDIVNVRLTAAAVVAFDGATLPIGGLIEDALPSEVLGELRSTRVSESDTLDLELTAVLEGDRWYFSVFHTVAELARRDAGSPPIPLAGLAAAGAATPEEAVNELLDSVESLDLGRLIATLDPYEAAALQRYAPLFVDDAQTMLDQVPLTWTIDTREFRIDGDGDARTVFVDAIGISGRVEGAEFEVRIEGDCLQLVIDGDSIEQCGAGPAGALDDFAAEAPAVGALVSAVDDAFADMESVGLELRRRDGRWYVAPIATGSEALLSVLRALDRDEIELIAEQAEHAFDDLFAVLAGSPWGVPGVADPWGADESGDDSWGLEEPVEIGWSCYEATTATDAMACYDEAIAAGEITVADVPAALRYPECGVADLLWAGEVYAYDDDAFTAALAPGVGCFADLVRAGQLDEWEVPFEIRYFDCFEGRNWFAEFEDTEYNERVDGCLSAAPPFGG